MTDDSKITLDTETTETTEASEAPETTEAPQTPAETTAPGGDGQGEDANILGQVGRDKQKQIQDYREQVGTLTAELGRVTARLMRMESQVDEVREQQKGVAEQLAKAEATAQEYLNNIGTEFGIQQGEPWQILPDGTVRKIDPNLLQAARLAAEANARAQAQ